MIDTSKGPARFLEFPAGRARATLILGHGAGGGGVAPDLQAIAEALPGHGVADMWHEPPWKGAGQRVAPAPARRRTDPQR